MHAWLGGTVTLQRNIRRGKKNLVWGRLRSLNTRSEDRENNNKGEEEEKGMRIDAKSTPPQEKEGPTQLYRGSASLLTGQPKNVEKKEKNRERTAQGTKGEGWPGGFGVLTFEYRT